MAMNRRTNHIQLQANKTPNPASTVFPSWKALKVQSDRASSVCCELVGAVWNGPRPPLGRDPILWAESESLWKKEPRNGLE